MAKLNIYKGIYYVIMFLSWYIKVASQPKISK